MVLVSAALALGLPHGLAAQATPTDWYGPERLTFVYQVPGNPYDPDQNDVRVRFVDGKGKVVERLAYYDGDGQWGAVLVANNPGPYKAVATRNGKELALSANFEILPCDHKLTKGYIRRNPLHANRFRWDDGDPYYPLGHNLCWKVDGQPPLTDLLSSMAANDENWARIWACSWDGKNPWWPKDDQAIPGQLWPRALSALDDIVEASAKDGVAIQLVLEYHGTVSTTVDSDWPANPWNAANGGFLKSPSDYFTDPEAKRRVKMWLRYAVARWAWSPDLFAWELFNEVENTDAAHDGQWSDIAAWHKDMADYVRSIDPYGHLVTTSSTMDQPGLWAPMDFYQPHEYSSDIGKTIAGMTMPSDKPCFIGEFEQKPTASTAKVNVRNAILNGLYASLISNPAGAAMCWSWESVNALGLEGDFKTAAHAVRLSNIADHPLAKPQAVSAIAGGNAIRLRALTDSDWAVFRIAGGGASLVLQGAGLADGAYDVSIMDLDADSSRKFTATASGGRISISAAFPMDAFVVLERRG